MRVELLGGRRRFRAAGIRPGGEEIRQGAEEAAGLEKTALNRHGEVFFGASEGVAPKTKKERSKEGMEKTDKIKVKMLRKVKELEQLMVELWWEGDRKPGFPLGHLQELYDALCSYRTQETVRKTNAKEGGNGKLYRGDKPGNKPGFHSQQQYAAQVKHFLL